jgi:hypothetical protein
MYERVLIVEKHKQRSEFESDDDLVPWNLFPPCLFFDLMMTCYTVSDWRLIRFILGRSSVTRLFSTDRCVVSMPASRIDVLPAARSTYI